MKSDPISSSLQKNILGDTLKDRRLSKGVGTLNGWVSKSAAFIRLWLSDNAGSDWSAQRHLRMGAAGMAVLVLGFGTWSVTANISGAIITSGQVAIESNRQIVQHPDGGVVVDILAREGSVVEAGDTLLRLDGIALNSELEILTGQLYETEARFHRLNAEKDMAEDIAFPPDLLRQAAEREDVRQIIEGQSNLFATRQEVQQQEIAQFERRKEQISSQIFGVDAQLDALETQITLTEEELAVTEKLLESNLTRASGFLELKRRHAAFLGQVGELTATRAELEERMTEIDVQVLQLTSESREAAITELRDVSLRRSEVKERHRALIERLLRLDLTAPVSGVVYDMTVFADRSVIRPAEPVLYIIPQGQELIVQTRIDPVNVALVYPGQTVALRFSSFDPNDTPELEGRVVRVSADSFVDDATGQSYYRGEVILEDGQIALLEGQILLPGMPVEAFIRTQDRTLLGYITQPFTEFFHRAFREG